MRYLRYGISGASCSNPMSQHLGADRTTAGGHAKFAPGPAVPAPSCPSNEALYLDSSIPSSILIWTFKAAARKKKHGHVRAHSIHKKQSCAWKLWQIPDLFNTEAQGGGVGGVSVVKNFFFGKTRFKSYLTINQSQKLKLIFFHIFLTASGEGGGSTQVVSLTAFSQFFLTLP